jgi:thymidine kinase
MGLTIIMGNMFSGKTSELIRRLKRYRIIGKKIVVINSTKDTRSPDDMLKTHDGIEFPCLKVEHISHCIIKQEFCDAEIVAIDEAQFFTNLRDFVQMCLFLKKSVIIAGLDGDYRQRKFGEVLDCIPMASDVIKLSALCMDCKNGTPGPFTKRIVESDELELVGGKDCYKAVCRKHLETMNVQDKNDSFLKSAFNKAMKSRVIK